MSADSGTYSGDFKLDVFDTWTFLIIGPVSAAASLILLVAHILSKELRKQPGDLIMMISLAELGLSVHFILTAYRTSHISRGVLQSDPYCKFNSYLSITGQLLEFFYSICFLIHIYFTMNSSIQKGFVPKKTYHFVVIIITTIIAASAQGYIDKDPYGICSFRVGKMIDGKRKDVFRSLIIATIALMVGMFIAIFVLIFTQKKLPNFGSELNHLRREFLSYYKTYIWTCIVLWVLISLSFGCQILGDDEHIKMEKSWKGHAFEMGRIGNNVKVLLPLIFFLVRIQDPLIRKRIWAPFKIFSKEKSSTQNASSKDGSGSNKGSDELEQGAQDPAKILMSSPHINISNEAPNVTNERQIQMIEQKAMDDIAEMDEGDDLMWMNLLPAKIKESYTRTFLACIYLRYVDKLESKKNVVVLNKQDTQDVCVFPIKGSQIMKALDTNKSIIDCKFTIYCPAIFKEIIDSSFKKIDIRASLDIIANEDNIKKAGESGGGASGELFMFSHDSQLILKTANHEEIEIFKDLMLDYKDHLKRNKNTQISKIFGLFDFSFKESDKSIKLVLMENLFTINSECIMRKYDLKGSKHARKVITNYKELSLERQEKKVMKDLDFLEIEKHIDVDPSARIYLMQNIEQDVTFFKNHGIIDYSMILAVVSLCFMIGSQKES